ncbi:Response regulator mcs4, partial [Colletotrichum shisoi]
MGIDLPSSVTTTAPINNLPSINEDQTPEADNKTQNTLLPQPLPLPPKTGATPIVTLEAVSSDNISGDQHDQVSHALGTPALVASSILPTSPRPDNPPRRQSLIPSRQTTLIRNLLEARADHEANPAIAESLISNATNMVTRKVWVRRPGASPTIITINEDDLVDDVRDMILRKYANSLGRHFDSPDLTLRICPREQRQDRLLGPEEPMGRTLDAYFPGGQNVDEALVIDIPTRRTPRPSPRAPTHATTIYYNDDGRPSEAGEGSRPKKAKKNVDHPTLPTGILNGGVPPINVLIVEDNPINLKLLEAFVKRLKVRWKTAVNGRDAVTMWRTGGFHLVLMDIQLPIMSGLEATREIRRLERVNSIGVFSSSASSVPEAPNGEPEEKDKLTNMELFKSPVIIVALTASSLQSDRHEALAAGCNDFLTKPVNFVWLERKVMEWGCMQALIDFDGWRRWKDFSQQNDEAEAKKSAALKTKAKKNRLNPFSSHHIILHLNFQWSPRRKLANSGALSAARPFLITMPPRAGSSLSPLALGSKWCDAHASKTLRSRPAVQLACAFSTTSQQSRRSKPQHELQHWLKARGSIFRDVPSDGPKYLTMNNDQPFPLNPFFKSQPVLSEDMREEIFTRVKEKKESLKLVSAELGVDVRRVAAVVRMMEVEKQWIAERKPLARPYARAVLRMLPQTELNKDRPDLQSPHEPINEIHVHRLTMQQLFVPVSESRQFDREDAAKAFHRKMLSVDGRSPHKELISMRKAAAAGGSAAELTKKFREVTRAEEDRLVERERRRLEKAEKETQRVDTGRFEFRFKEMNVDSAGRDGRNRRGVGWRYGVPFYDRRKGE